MVEVVAALIWNGDRFLICQRPAEKKRAGKWEFPGGKVEPGETPEQAIARECREELGIALSVGGMAGETEWEYPDVRIRLRLYDAVIHRGEVALREHADARWICGEELSSFDLCPADRVLAGIVSHRHGNRCAWCRSDGLLLSYHDAEWGIGQLHDDRKQFEFLTLEAMQCGLSWLLVLRKREAMRAAFDGFDPQVVSRYGEGEIARALAAPGIIHSERKIRAMVGNAAAFCRIAEEEGSFDDWFWRFSGGKTLRRAAGESLPAETPLSREIAGALREKGFLFLGPVVLYSHMQAVGMVDDHDETCFARKMSSCNC